MCDHLISRKEVTKTESVRKHLRVKSVTRDVRVSVGFPCDLFVDRVSDVVAHVGLPHARLHRRLRECDHCLCFGCCCGVTTVGSKLVHAVESGEIGDCVVETVSVVPFAWNAGRLLHCVIRLVNLFNQRVK
jgi:hypothetical protein